MAIQPILNDTVSPYKLIYTIQRSQNSAERHCTMLQCVFLLVSGKHFESQFTCNNYVKHMEAVSVVE